MFGRGEERQSHSGPVAALLAVAAAGALCAPPVAGATSQVSKVAGVMTITGDDNSDKLSIGPWDFAIVARGPLGSIVAGAGCTQSDYLNEAVVGCGGQGDISKVVAQLGGGNDEFSVASYPSTGPAEVDGGDGDDILSVSGGYANKIVGGAGNDTIGYGGGNDAIDGGPGNDKLSGGPGDDTIVGGPGQDSINGDSDQDAITGGNDRIEARDGEHDTIGCQGGADTAILDSVDLIAAPKEACESVDIAPSPTPTPGPTPTPATLTKSSAKQAAIAALNRKFGQRWKKATKKRLACSALTAGVFECKASWRYRRKRMSRRVVVTLSNGTVATRIRT